MKKIIALVVLMGAVMTGCTSNSAMAYTFDVETGDSIKVALNTSDSDYKLNVDGSRFIVKEEDNDVVTGIFLTSAMYDQYESAISETGTILESDGYILYEFAGEAGTEHNILLMVPDSDTGIIMASLEEEETVKDVYGRLSFTNEK